MNFFCTKNHYEEWTAERGLNEADVFCLDVREAMRVAEMLFENQPVSTAGQG